MTGIPAAAGGNRNVFLTCGLLAEHYIVRGVQSP